MMKEVICDIGALAIGRSQLRRNLGVRLTRLWNRAGDVEEDVDKGGVLGVGCFVDNVRRTGSTHCAWFDGSRCRTDLAVATRRPNSVILQAHEGAVIRLHLPTDKHIDG